MKALWALLLALPVSAGQIKAVPKIAAPVSPAFAATGPEFFRGATKIVDLGGEAMSPWSVDLARAQPQAQVHLVNIEDAKLPLSLIREDWGVPNLHTHTYDMFSPPAQHPTAQRVVMNSPNFGGIQGRLQALELVRTIDRHLEPGGLFYAQGDNLFFMPLRELGHAVRRDLAAIELGRDRRLSGYKWVGEVIAEREALVHEALEGAFGKENVSRRPLRDYEGPGLNAPGDFAFQVRKR